VSRKTVRPTSRSFHSIGRITSRDICGRRCFSPRAIIDAKLQLAVPTANNSSG
jgi:hypothetical protein